MNASENLWNAEELLEQLEQQQNEIDQLEQQKLELAMQIQTLSLQNSELQNELQSRSDRIVKLNGQIANLSESDRQLREAAEKLAQSKAIECQTAKREQLLQMKEKQAEDTIANYYKLIANTKKEQDELAYKHQNFQAIVEKTAHDYSRKDRQKNRTQYLIQKGMLAGYVTGLSLLLLLLSALSIIRQKTFLSDLSLFVKTLWNGITTIIATINNLSLQATTLTNQIQNPTIATVAWWGIRIGIPLVAVAIIITALVLLTKRYGSVMIEKGFNQWNVSLSIVILAVFIFFGDYVKKLTDLNLVGIWLIADVVLIVGAWYIRGEYDKNKLLNL